MADVVTFFATEFTLRGLFLTIGLASWAVSLCLLCCACCAPCRIVRAIRRKRSARSSQKPFQMLTKKKDKWLSDEVRYDDLLRQADHDSDNESDNEEESALSEVRDGETKSASRRWQALLAKWCSLSRVYAMLAAFTAIGAFLVSGLSYMPWLLSSLLVAALWIAVLFRNSRARFHVVTPKLITVLVVAVVGLIALALFIGYATSGICLCMHPMQFTTRFSRSFKGPSCAPNEVCHLYFTVADDFTSQIIVNTHITTENDLNGMNITFWNANSTTTSRSVASSCFKMVHITEESRYVCWADLKELASGQCYEVKATPNITGISKIQDSESSTGRFCTAKNNGVVPFISGGDYEIGEDARQLANFALKIDPLFAIVGGDITYENAMIECYRRYDDWFREWRRTMNNMPIITSIGNHDAGQYYDAPRERSVFYLRYFPAQVGLGALAPYDRSTFHRHQITNDFSITVLDSGVISPVAGNQTNWLSNVLANDTSSLKVLTYHYAIYSSKPGRAGMQYFVDEALKNWVPLFDRANVTLSFENHNHVYKQTFAIRDNKKVGSSNSSAGVTFLGDGAWGLHGGGSGSMAWWTERLESFEHIYLCNWNSATRVVTARAIRTTGEVFSSIEKKIV